MNHYRMYKLRTVEGGIVAAKDIEATNDRAAMLQAQQDDDCPICEVWQGAKKIGSIEP